MRNITYMLRKEHAKTYINRLLKLGHTFEVAPHIRWTEVTVNIETVAPRKEWEFNPSERPVYPE